MLKASFHMGIFVDVQSARLDNVLQGIICPLKSFQGAELGVGSTEWPRLSTTWRVGERDDGSRAVPWWEDV